MGNEDDDHEQHVVLEAVDVVSVDYGVIATKITTIVPKITTRIMIAQRILAFWVRSKNQCTLENDKEDEEVDEGALMRAVVEMF